MNTIDLFTMQFLPEKRTKGKLNEHFIEPPFSILNAQKSEWQERKRWWRDVLGINSEKGRGETKPIFGLFLEKDQFKAFSSTSIFDSHLAEVIYSFFCPDNGKILDPFAGGSVRGIVANYLDYHYSGIDIRLEQIEEDLEQARKIIPDKMPDYFCGDSLVVLDEFPEQSFDLIFSCPPYGDLQVYSDLPGDISNMSYSDFIKVYEQIINKACMKLKKGGFAVFVVGQFRDKKGHYVGFVPDTIRAFQKAGLFYYNEMILAQPICSAAMRAKKPFLASKKITKIHQNVLVFKKEIENE